MIKFISKSSDDTKNIGRIIAKDLKHGAVISINGDLGSGKTVLVKGIASFFDIENEISSPTFTIVNEYTSATPIYHFDVYRLNDSSEFLEVGLDEYFDKGICLIEWGEIINDILPKNTLSISITRNIQDENIRIIEIKGIDKI